jgi:hypothetical protein
MKAIFYCSYDFSAYGFQFVSVDFGNGTANKIEHTEIPKDIYKYFSRAGIRILSGYTEENKGFFLVKGLKHYDESRTRGDQGYTQNYNLAFISDDKHSAKNVFALAAFVLCHYRNFIPAIASTFVITPDVHAGYTVDVRKLDDFINRAIDKANVKNQFIKPEESPSGNKFKFAVLLAGWEYATSMLDLPKSTPQPDRTFSEDEFKQLVEDVPIDDDEIVTPEDGVKDRKSDMDRLIRGVDALTEQVKSLENEIKALKSCMQEHDNKPKYLKYYLFILGLLAGFLIRLLF